jgi:hypothetical protein
MLYEQNPSCAAKQPSVAQYDEAIGALEKEQGYTDVLIDQILSKLDRVLSPERPVLDDACMAAPEKWQGPVLDHIDSLNRKQARMSFRLHDILSRLPF